MFAAVMTFFLLKIRGGNVYCVVEENIYRTRALKPSDLAKPDNYLTKPDISVARAGGGDKW